MPSLPSLSSFFYRSTIVATALVLSTASLPAHAQRAPETATAIIESGFSPNGAEPLVLKGIASATSSIRVAAYSFTSPQVVRALIKAKNNGVDVQIVVDEKGNKNKSSIAALNLVKGAGIPTRTISVYKIQHSKYMVIDGKHLETGSFNYSNAAAKSNSENVLLIWNNSVLAKSYSDNWQMLFNQGKDYQSSF